MICQLVVEYLDVEPMGRRRVAKAVKKWEQMIHRWERRRGQCLNWKATG
jgi:hypothetical protein